MDLFKAGVFNKWDCNDEELLFIEKSDELIDFKVIFEFEFEELIAESYNDCFDRIPASCNISNLLHEVLSDNLNIGWGIEEPEPYNKLPVYDSSLGDWVVEFEVVSNDEEGNGILVDDWLVWWEEDE